MTAGVPPGDEREPNERPVGEVAAARLPVGAGLLPVALSEDWDAPLPHVTGALVILHGRLRNAGDYLRSGIAALGGRAGWLVVAPQFLAPVDVAAHGLPDAVLRWDLTGWMGGDAALAPERPSAFAAIDAVLARLRSLPGLSGRGLAGPGRVVLAGHSGGGQVAQRYAMLGGDVPGLRYVVANPSSYAFLGPERPCPVADCPGHDDWKYGLSALPPHAGTLSRAALASRYARRDVRYLVGGLDTDPRHPALDRSPPALCQGPHRRARAEAFVADLRARFPDSAHRLAVVPGVAHDAAGMFASAQGEAALFE